MIVIAAEKGGVGKTMLTATLAVLAFLTGAGARVAVLDHDPQGSLTSWWNRREAEWPQLFSLAGPLDQTVNAISAKGVDYLFVDTAPGHSAFRRAAVRLADLVLVPTGPGALDQAGIAPAVELADRHGAAWRIVLARGGFRTRTMGEAVVDLRARAGFLDAPLHDRQAVLKAVNSGRAVGETEPDSPAAREAWKLWRTVLAELAGLPQRQRPTTHVDMRRAA